MLTQSSIPEFRKATILELHDTVLHSIPPMGFLPGEYYAVDYVQNYYFGRVFDASGPFVKFKFLHKVGANTFDWRERDDIDAPLISCISLVLPISNTIDHSKLRNKQLWRRYSRF